MSEPDVGAFAHALLEAVRVEAEMDGCDLHEAFTRLMLEQLCADGHAEDAVPVHFRDHGVEISGYGSSTDGLNLDLFLTQYSPRADEDHKANRNTIEAAFRRLEQFLTRCLSGTVEKRNPSSDVTGMCEVINKQFGDVERIRFILITNARSVMRDRLPTLSYQGRTVSREVWDLQRLANWAASGSKAEPIVAEFPQGLHCLATPHTNQDYSVLLTIVPGPDLAELYSTHGARLLELNVRSFLQLRGGVNRGILETLKGSPERFLAYNNGIAATASHVEFDETASGQRLIRRIHGLQIVNGGQTTATIHHAYRSKVNIGDVLVQMKLTVISPDLLDDIVPQIAEYSNTQNRVTASDLKANSGFHVDVERIMRTLWAPPTPAHQHDTHWFYERARGQYANALARETPRSRQSVFKITNPPTQKFIKSELAKFEHAWARRPHLVSLGAEKNFALFSEELDKNPIAVDKEYCRHLVAKAILFRRTDRIIAGRKFGGYKANIVAYTVSKLVDATGARIDLDRIWREQDLTSATKLAVDELCGLIQKVITSPPSTGVNVGEWCKRPECWEAVRDIDWVVPTELTAELIPLDRYPDDLQLLRGTGAADWLDVATWGSATGLLDDMQQRAAKEIAHALSNDWSPAGKHVSTGVALMRHARAHGFRAVNGF